MTAIVGIRDGKRVLLGADSMAVEGCGSKCVDVPKLWNWDKIIAGGAGPAHVLQAIHFLTDAPKGRIPKAGPGLTCWVAMKLGPEIQKAAQCAAKEDGDSDQWSLLLGIRGELYELDCHGLAYRVSEYLAVGNGADTAMGALYATAGMGPEARAELALDAASSRCIGVGGPHSYMST